MEQDEIDTIFYRVETSANNQLRSLPKGIQEITLNRILQCFEKNPFSQSAEEISKSTGIVVGDGSTILEISGFTKRNKKGIDLWIPGTAGT